jgi:hypothetical protein
METSTYSTLAQKNPSFRRRRPNVWVKSPPRILLPIEASTEAVPPSLKTISNFADLLCAGTKAILNERLKMLNRNLIIKICCLEVKAI